MWGGVRQLLPEGWKADMGCAVDAPLGAGSYLAGWIHLNTGWESGEDPNRCPQKSHISQELMRKGCPEAGQAGILGRISEIWIFSE